MFARQRQQLPLVRPIVVGELTLVDIRELQKGVYSEEDLLPIRRAWRRLQEYVTSQRPGTLVCENDTSVMDAYLAAYDLHRAKHPEATTDDFDLIYEPTLDDSATDPRLAKLTFSVATTKAFVGIFHLYNIVIEGQSIDKTVVSACASPSFRTARGYLDPDDLGGIMKHLLERDMTFRGSGRVLDLIEWRFPGGDHAWVERSGGTLTHRALAHLAAHDREDASVGSESIPRRIRRR